MSRRGNPFELTSDVEHFPNLAQVFTNSPTIDTIARTQPADFSLDQHTNAGSQANSAAGSHRSDESPGAGARQQGAQGGARRSVVKQLDFSDSTQGARLASCSTEGAKGQGDKRHSWRSGAEGPDYVASEAERSAPAAAPDVLCEQSSGPTRNVAVQTEAARPLDRASEAPEQDGHAQWPQKAADAVAAEVRSSNVAAARSDHPVAYGLPPKPAMLHPRPAWGAMNDVKGGKTGMPPRSPSSPVLRPAKSVAFAPRGAASDDTVAADARRSLAQPPCYPFTEYLHRLQRRWGHPLTPSRFDALGVSPPRRPLSYLHASSYNTTRAKPSWADWRRPLTESPQPSPHAPTARVEEWSAPPRQAPVALVPAHYVWPQAPPPCAWPAAYSWWGLSMALSPQPSLAPATYGAAYAVPTGAEPWVPLPPGYTTAALPPVRHMYKYVQ